MAANKIDPVTENSSELEYLTGSVQTAAKNRNTEQEHISEMEETTVNKRSDEQVN